MNQDRCQDQGPDPRRGAALISSNMSGEIVVIKYGGNAMINEELKEAVIKDVVLLNLIGMQASCSSMAAGRRSARCSTRSASRAQFAQRSALHR